MSEQPPAAFLSYTRFDDEHDGGRISLLRATLEGEIRAQTGEQVTIFQDRNDVLWGQNWEARIDLGIDSSTFLIPVITPNFFRSPFCRKEFLRFLEREKILGRADLIFPIYYIESDEIENPSADDEISRTVKSRQWVDWRASRFQNILDTDGRQAIFKLAADIKRAIKETRTLRDAERHASEVPQVDSVSMKPRRAPKKLTKINDGLPAIRTFEGLKSSERKLEARQRPYYTYTTKYDEVCEVSNLVSGDELARLNKTLKSNQKVVTSDFNSANVVSKWLGAKGRENVAITLLLDNSGSLRGRPILVTAIWIRVFMEIVSLLDIKVEVLGFTTRAWRGGKSRELWKKDGEPVLPGRLNDLRHIIYKKFEDRFSTSPDNYGLLVKDGLLKENVDGEALLWAWGRLMKCDGSKRHLVLISDGAPVDDSTISANSDHFLQDHFGRVCRWIERNGECNLHGISLGTRHLGPFIKHSIAASEPEDLGSALEKTFDGIFRV